MARKICDICGKANVVGRSQQHKRGVAGKRWKKRSQSTRRVFTPNLQMKTVIVGGDTKKMRLCTKCIKRIENYKSIKEYKSIVFV